MTTTMYDNLMDIDELKNTINTGLEKEENKGISYYDTYLNMLKSISPEDIDKIISLNISLEEKQMLFDIAIETHKDTVKPELDRVMDIYMTTNSMSYGEAYILADKHFQREVNHLSLFSMGLMSILLLKKSEVNFKKED